MIVLEVIVAVVLGVVGWLTGTFGLGLMRDHRGQIGAYLGVMILAVGFFLAGLAIPIAEMLA